MYPPLAEMVAFERRQTLLAEADARRLRRQARVMRPTGQRHPLLLALVARVRRLDVRIRPIRVSDGDLLVDAFDRLSERSRRMRFLSPKGELSAAEIRYFTDVDHHDHEALVAVSRLTGRGLGVARYVRNRDDEASADVAVAVVDAWHRMGVGSELIDRLAQRAECEGVHRFTAVISSENAAARRLILRNPEAATLVSREAGTLGYEVQLRPLLSAQSHRRLRIGAAAEPCGAAS